MRRKHILAAFLPILFLTACQITTAGSTTVPTTRPETMTAAQASPTVVSTATPTPKEPTAAPVSTMPVIEVEPTCTPTPGDDRVSVGDLPMGQAGNYVNLAFGYHLQYPPTWYTGFGSRPLLVSLSNLDPGTHNRLSIRLKGCLIEVRASTNVYGLTLQDIKAQLPRAFHGAEDLDLAGEPALRVRQSSEENPFESEWIYVQHGDRLFVLTIEYAKEAGEICHPAWENLLSTWEWFEPEFAVYRNLTYGYAISYPRHWYRFNPQEQGISISSQDPTNLTNLEKFLERAMLVETDIFDNPNNLPLKEWLAAQDWKIDLTNDIPLDGLIGVRVLREALSPEIQEMSGYFQGPLGKIYKVTCLYPADQQWEFRPIANAILYSFSF